MLLRRIFGIAKRSVIARCPRRWYSSSGISPKFCVVGSGPAGFYTAQHILKGNPSCTVDIYDRLPVPFGLVRYGVAPDHPEVKNVISTFTKTMSSPRAHFLGNVNVGVDVSVKDLRDAYHAVVLSYGCDEDHKLGVPGEESRNVVSAREFVNWYNGLPSYSNLEIDLSHERAVVIGQGNVAVDVARILLSPIDKLAETDITDNALAILSESRVREVLLIGRRGPLNAAFTIKELREMIKLPGCKPDLLVDDFKGILDELKDLPRAKKRLTELLVKTALEPPPASHNDYDAAKKSWGLRFLKSPKAFIYDNDNRVMGIELSVNCLEGIFPNQKAVSTDKVDSIQCGLVLKSVGYKGLNIDQSLPFDAKRGVILNDKGRVTGCAGVYASGWIQSGPVGVIISTMNSGFQTGKLILEDLAKGYLVQESKPGSDLIKKLLSEKGVQICSFDDWSKVDEIEVQRGKLKGKLREKVLRIDEMLSIMKN